MLQTHCDSYTVYIHTVRGNANYFRDVGVCTAIILCPDTLRFSFQTLTCIYTCTYTCTWIYSAWSALYMIVCTWHTGGYPQCDLNTVNGGLPDIEVWIRTARDHTAKNLALERQVSRWLIFI